MLLPVIFLFLPFARLAATYPAKSIRSEALTVSPGVQNARCDQGILPTPKYGTTNASFTICTEELINAPMRTIYNALLDFRKYSTWNTFVIDVEAPDTVQDPSDVYIGLSMNFTTQGLILGVNTTSVEVVTLLDPPKGKYDEFSIVSWESGVLVQGEHPTSLTVVGKGIVRMVSWETYYTPTDVIVLPLKESLQTEFVQQGKDLKAYVEGLKGGWGNW